jgi:hypothetical protein
MLDQEADGEGEQAAGGFVAGDQERLALGHDVVVVQLLAGLLVHSGEHGAEQILVLFDVSGAPPLVDDLLDFALHVAVVLGQFARSAAPQLGLDGQFPGASRAFSQYSVHRLDEGMQCVAVEGVEAVAETA